MTLWMPNKKKPLYAPMLATFGGGSVRGFKAGSVEVDTSLQNPYFETTTYTGNGSTQTITSGMNFSANDGAIWLKRRDGTGQDHNIYDTVRGAYERLKPNQDYAENTQANGLSSFNTDGWTMGSSGNINSNAASYVAWSLQVQPRFFDVQTWIGNGVNGRTISHNLGTDVGFMMVKKMNAGRSWINYHTSLGGTKYLENNNEAGAGTVNTVWNDTDATSSTITLGTNSSVNNNGDSYVAYIFAHDPDGTDDNGFIACGEYTGNGSTSGPTIDIGWTPQFLIIKRYDTSSDWNIIDNVRGFSAGNDEELNIDRDFPATTGSNFVNPTSTGFRLGTTDISYNANTGNYLYIAIR
jgi:hypothetical protein